MGEVYTYNATHLTTIRDGSIELTQCAELGQVGTGRVAIDDTAGTQTITGQKDFSVTQSSCSVPLVFRGFVENRRYGRSAGVDRAPHVGASRGIDVALQDLNVMLGFRLIDGEDGERQAETVEDRGDWLMGSDYMSGLVADNGRCSFPSGQGMDAADYRHQFPGDVLADMAQAALGYNYHVNDWGSGPELTFRDDNASTADSSTLRISNVLSDASAVTLNPFKDATLSRRSDRVYSKIALSHAKGTVVEERAATATAFNGERGGVAANSNLKTDSKASQEATNMLFQHSTEEDIIECTVLVTSAQVNLILAGQRIEAKFSHLNVEGYGSFTWFRILLRTVRPVVADGDLYHLVLRLSPQEAGAPAAQIVQMAVTRGSEGGATLELANPVTIGSHLIFAISDRGSEDPGGPNTGASQPRFGAGAWTRFNGATLTRDVNGNGCAMYWKVADSVEQVGYVGGSNVVCAVWEVSGADPASAAVAYRDQYVGGTDYAIGSVGTVGTDQVAFCVYTIGNQPASGDWAWGGPGAAPTGGYAWNVGNPNPSISAGWTLAISKWAYDNFSAGYFIPIQPWSIMAHAVGTGVALNPTITPGEAGHAIGAVAIRVPHA